MVRWGKVANSKGHKVCEVLREREDAMDRSNVFSGAWKDTCMEEQTTNLVRVVAHLLNKLPNIVIQTLF